MSKNEILNKSEKQKQTIFDEVLKVFQCIPSMKNAFPNAVKVKKLI